MPYREFHYRWEFDLQSSPEVPLKGFAEECFELWRVGVKPASD